MMMMMMTWSRWVVGPAGRDDDDDDNDEDGDDDGDDDDDDDGRAQHLPGQCSSQTHTTQCHSIAFGVFFSNSTAVTLG